MQSYSIVPGPRQDVLVTDVATGQPRRMTLYTGVVWLAPPPSFTETSVLGLRAVSTSGRAAFVRSSEPLQVFLPDSLAYRREAIASAVVSASGGLLGYQDTSTSREATILLATGVTFVDDPQRQGITWLGLTMTMHGHIWSVSYQVSVTAAPEAVA